LQHTAAAQAVDAVSKDSTSKVSRTGTSSSSNSAGQVSEGWVLRALVKLDSDEIDRHAKVIAAAKVAAEEEADNVVASSKETAAAQTIRQLQKGGGQEDAQGSGSQPGSDATATAATAAATAAGAKCAVQLSEVLQTAVGRAKALGVEVFSGDKEAEGCRLLEWMSSMAWNAALHVTGEQLPPA
jgi:hypothetical protein